ncbi:DUF2501 domain-containing protein [Acetobacter sp. AN02]|uniref:DUF2501 domain-containing protein n=1 Tax=Acetobacter sp. AN02 TaxID=2894186 RepID=UPI002434219F|nr:DUF2501 domain-containing protein [Acetobacter sp. AN02]MDG6094603.1 DUF2501 domain-containing protein [Acetobacter sp. AN02]
MTISSRIRIAVVAALAVSAPAAAHAQLLGNMIQSATQGATSGAMNSLTNSTSGLTSGLSGLTNGLNLSSLASANSGNVSGVLNYCIQNNMLSGAQGNTATSTLGSLTQQSQISPSNQSYVLGQQGILQTGTGNQVSLSSLDQSARQRLCSLILNKAQSFL